MVFGFSCCKLADFFMMYEMPLKTFRGFSTADFIFLSLVKQLYRDLTKFDYNQWSWCTMNVLFTYCNCMLYPTILNLYACNCDYISHNCIVSLYHNTQIWFKKYLLLIQCGKRFFFFRVGAKLCRSGALLGRTCLALA